MRIVPMALDESRGGPRTSVSGTLFSVLDERRAIRDAVVKLHGGMVGFVRQPVRPGRATTSCIRIDMLDQRPADALAASIGRNKQVLKIALVARRPGGSMVDRMHQLQSLSAIHGKRGMHRLHRVREARQV